MAVRGGTGVVRPRSLCVAVCLLLVATTVIELPRLVHSGAAPAPTDQQVPDENPDATPVPEPASLAAAAAPGDGVQVTVVADTVDRNGTTITTSQAFDLSVVGTAGTTMAVPPLDTDPATPRPDRSTVRTTAGSVTITEVPPAGWSVRSVRCGSDSFVAQFDGINRQWVVFATITGDTTCHVVHAQDGVILTVVHRTVDTAGQVIAVATDVTYAIGLPSGGEDRLVLDTDPFSTPPATGTVIGPPGRYTVGQLFSRFGSPISVVCDGDEVALGAVYPPTQLPRWQAQVNLDGPATCVVTDVEIDGLHTLKVIHRTIDANGNDIASSTPFDLTAKTAEGSGVDTFTLDSDPATGRSDRFTVSHLGGVALLSQGAVTGWRLASIVCDGRSLPLASGALSAPFPLTGDSVCVLTSRQQPGGPSATPDLTLRVRTLDANGVEFAATDPADSFQAIAFNSDFSWFDFPVLDTDPATAAPASAVVHPPVGGSPCR